MGKRSVKILEAAVLQIAEASWFIESKGLIATADKFSESAYDYIETLSRDNISFKPCREPERALLGFKCVRLKQHIIV